MSRMISFILKSSSTDAIVLLHDKERDFSEMESLIKPPAAAVATVFRAILPDVDPDSVRRFPVRGQNDLNIATPGQSAW